MVAKRKQKYSTGEAAQFISRKQALNKLQLTLKDFRRLCIIKGIYPREPRNRKRAQKGAQGIRTLYHIKDIQFLMHEPIIWKLREFKIFNRKVGRARAIKDFRSMHAYLNNHPTLKLDHIVKERYPTFVDAIRDLDDCLSLCFLFSTFPSLPHIPREQSALCRRLTVEFMHYVVESKSLRKVFISIKGYYYQADIKGQTITWIVPHHFSFEPQSKVEVDFKIMSTFVEFYTVLLGFVNYRLYHSLNMFYPPKFEVIAKSDAEKSLVDEDTFVAERVAALNMPILRSTAEDDAQIDSFDGDNEEERTEAEKIRTLQKLFCGKKFFLNREVPREPLVFIIRSLGGEVSWDKTLFVGATFDETDETITHHIVDRPKMETKYLSRYYVQPQWLFDCVNRREIVPIEKYFLGEALPPHLSPFVDKDRDEEYIPPEEKTLYDSNLLEEMHKNEENDNSDEESNDDGNPTGQEGGSGEASSSSKNTKLQVKQGELYKEVPWEAARQEKQEFRLREKMVPRKHRNLYKSMKKGKEVRAKDTWLLKKKRRLLDEKEANKSSKSSK